MAPSTNPPPRSGCAILHTKVEANKIEKRANKSTALKNLPREADVLTHTTTKSSSHHSTIPLSSSASNQWQPASQHSAPRSPSQDSGSHSSPAYDREDSREPELTPPVDPLTELNLQEHTHCTSPIAQLASTDSEPEQSRAETLKSMIMADSVKLQEYGVVLLKNRDPRPDEIDSFLRETVLKSRDKETPGAQRLADCQARASETKTESTAAEIISTWLMFPDQSHQFLDGELWITLINEAQFNREYFLHKDSSRNLPQSRPDRTNGYVSRAYSAEMTSPFSEEEEYIIRHHMVPLLHDEALFPWLTAEFKSALGQSIAWATLQCARHGVGVCNYMHRFYAAADITASMTESIHFSVACDANQAILLVHWIGDDGKYYMQQACQAHISPLTALETKNDHMVLMRMYMRNILDWATGERLGRIRAAINSVQQRIDATKAGTKAQPKGKGKGKANQTADQPAEPARLSKPLSASESLSSTLDNLEQSSDQPRRSTRNLKTGKR